MGLWLILWVCLILSGALTFLTGDGGCSIQGSSLAKPQFCQSEIGRNSTSRWVKDGSIETQEGFFSVFLRKLLKPWKPVYFWLEFNQLSIIILVSTCSSEALKGHY